MKLLYKASTYKKIKNIKPKRFLHAKGKPYKHCTSQSQAGRVLIIYSYYQIL